VASTSQEGYGGGLFVGKAGDQIDEQLQSGAAARFVGPSGARGASPTVTLTGNRYDENGVDDSQNSRRGRGGGGALFLGVFATSSAERYTRNTLPGGGNCECESSGGGLTVSGTPNGRSASFDAVNLVVAGNSIGSDGEGGGIYIGGEAPTTLRLDHATVAGNAIGQNSRGPAIAADFNDSIEIVRSIVAGNANPDDRLGQPFAEVDGGTATARLSDICEAPPALRADPNGNICADPKLAGPTAAQGADVHQTPSSPTIDQVPAQETGNVAVDYEGDARPNVASARTNSPWDMGADEFITADYRVSVTDSPDPVTQGGKVTYTVTVTNTGPATVSGLSAGLTLPATAQLDSTSRAGRACSGGSQSCDVGALGPGASKSIAVVARLFTLGPNTATATVSGPAVDPTPNDHTATITTQVNAAGGLLPANVPARCSGLRRFTIHVAKRRDPVVSAVIRVNGKRVKVRKRNGRLIATVDLRTLPKGRTVVTISGTTRSGKKVKGKRVYHPCTKGRPGGIPNL
jgi:uncharacterized repeat protein (TIGR01451 family)